MVATAIYSVTMVLWKEIAFPLCRATERRWKRNVVSRVSSVIVVIRLPIPLVHVMPCTSCFYGKWVENVCAGQFGEFVYLVLCCLMGCCTWFCCCAVNVWLSICVWYTVTSQAIGFPLAHDRRVVPSGRLLSSCIRLIGSLTTGIWVHLIALHRMSFKWLWRCCLGRFCGRIVHTAHVHPLPYHTHKCVVHRL